MPVVIAWIGELIVSSVGAWALSALVTLGVGFVGSKIASGVIDSTNIMAAFHGPLWGWVGYLQIDTDITIILSAWAGRAITDSVKVHLARLPKKAA